MSDKTTDLLFILCGVVAFVLSGRIVYLFWKWYGRGEE